MITITLVTAKKITMAVFPVISSLLVRYCRQLFGSSHVLYLFNSLFTFSICLVLVTIYATLFALLYYSISFRYSFSLDIAFVFFSYIQLLIIVLATFGKRYTAYGALQIFLREFWIKCAVYVHCTYSIAMKWLTRGSHLLYLSKTSLHELKKCYNDLQWRKQFNSKHVLPETLEGYSLQTWSIVLTTLKCFTKGLLFGWANNGCTDNAYMDCSTSGITWLTVISFSDSKVRPGNHHKLGSSNSVTDSIITCVP